MTAPGGARRLLGPMLAAISVGCPALDPALEEPAFLMVTGDTARIVAPDTIPSGTAFQVLVETFGGGCVREIGHTEEKVSGSVVEIRPFNQRANISGRPVCPPDVLVLVHSVAVEIRRTGAAAIRVIGARNDVARVVPAQLERIIVVR